MLELRPEGDEASSSALHSPGMYRFSRGVLRYALFACNRNHTQENPMTHSSAYCAFLVAIFTICFLYSAHADIKPGDTITKENAVQAEEFLTPSIRWMVDRGMTIQVIETRKVKWPESI